MTNSPTYSTRRAALPVAIATLVLALAACQPEGGEEAATAPAADAAPGTVQVDALPTEKQQVSYMIGRDMARSLEEVKDDIDVDTLADAIRSGLEGEESLLTDEQTEQVRTAFAERVRNERVAEMQEKARVNKEEGAAFLAANAAKPDVQTTDSGLQYQVLTQGDGPRPAGDDVVRVHYTGTLLDGEKFDSSHDRGEPTEIPLDQVVPGWQEGITLMPVGSTYRFWIPGELGYGEAGTPGGPIGPNEVLVFEVELQDIVEAPAR